MRSPLAGNIVDSLAGKALAGVMIRSVGANLQLSTTVILAQSLGGRGLGIYLGWLSLIILGGTIARFGTGQLIVRVVAELPFEQTGSGLSVAAVGRVMMRMTLATSGVVFLALWVADVDARLASVVVAGIAASSVNAVASQYVRAVGEPARSQILNPFLVTALMFVLSVATRPTSSTHAVYLHSASMFLATAVAVGVVRWGQSRRPIQASTDRSVHAPGVYRVAGVLMFGELTSQSLVQLPSVVLPIAATAEIAGLFGAASRLTRPLVVVQAAVNHAAGPRVAGSTTAVSEARAHARRAALLSSTMSLPVAFVLVAYPHWVLGLLGSDFADAVSATRILALAILLSIVVGPVSLLLALRGFENDVTVAALLSALPLIGLLFVNSASEAALVVAAAILVRNVYAWCRVRTRLGFWLVPGRS